MAAPIHYSLLNFHSSFKIYACGFDKPYVKVSVFQMVRESYGGDARYKHDVDQREAAD